MSARTRRRPIKRSPDGTPAPSIFPAWIVFFALLLVTLVAYYPAWHGGLLWDDDAHLTRVDLRSLQGLGRIWFDVGATQQYYPVTHSVFWVLHRLFGDATIGYHLVNISLHATSAFLFAVILRRLAVPGAVLAAFIFALHPVHVESVAWITELKNTLSGVLYLGAALAYLRFDSDRQRPPYALALVLFILALLSKTVTATLPAALLVVFWWQRGQLRLRGDVLPLVPFFVLGVIGGAVTSWVERTHIGAEGAAFGFSAIERGLIAGRAIWFYLGKLIWPSNLVFIYPRWTIDSLAWWQYLFPLAAGLLLAVLWRYRTRSRAPLAAALLFIGTLVPALGFVNVYPFVFSFVADHFQYLASLGVIALIAAGATVLMQRRRVTPALTGGLAVLLVGASAVLTWRQSREYVDRETLYRATLRSNPSSPMVRNNLGELLRKRAGLVNPDRRLLEEAESQFREALRLRPDDFPQAHNNLGTTLLALDRFDAAIAEYHEALRFRPNDSVIRGNLSLALTKKANALQIAGRVDEAIAAGREALRISPDFVEAHGLLADALASREAFDQAIPHYRAFVKARPQDVNAWTGLGVASALTGRSDDAVAAFRTAVAASPGTSRLRQNLARALLANGQVGDAAQEAQRAVTLDGNDPSAYEVLGRVFAAQRRFDDARRAFGRALQLDPSFAPAVEGLRAIGR
jgi:Flp pilus assembly protein TadD